MQLQPSNSPPDSSSLPSSPSPTRSPVPAPRFRHQYINTGPVFPTTPTPSSPSSSSPQQDTSPSHSPKINTSPLFRPKLHSSPSPPAPASPSLSKLDTPAVASKPDKQPGGKDESTIEDRGPLSLTEFVLKYSTLLPIQMTVKKGYYGGDERHSIATDDVYSVHFVKRTKVVVLRDRRGATFNVPLNSAVQFAPVFNPNNNQKEAMKGLTFEKVSDIMAQNTLPKVIRAMKPHIRVDPKATIEQFEVFVVKRIVSVGVRKKALQVYSMMCNKEKLLPSDSVGSFTTEPQVTYIYLPDIIEHFLSDFPLEVQVVVGNGDISKEIPYYLTNEVASLTHIDSETSLIATTNWGKRDQVSEEDQMAIDIPVDLPIEVDIHHPDDTREEDLSVNTRRLYERFDPKNIRSLRSRHIRRGFEKEGMELQRPERIYDVPDVCFTKRSSPKRQDSVGTAARNGAMLPASKSKPRSIQPVSPRPRSKPVTQPPPGNSDSKSYQPLVMHTQLPPTSMYTTPAQQRPPPEALTTSPRGRRKTSRNLSSFSSSPDIEVVLARVEVLEREVYALRSEIAKLRSLGKLYCTCMLEKCM